MTSNTNVDRSNVLSEQTSEEARESLNSCDFAVLPCGTIEQHADHLPLSVDSIRAEQLTAELVVRASNFDIRLVKLPLLSYGYSEHHLNYPGTISLSAETLGHLVYDIGTSLERHGTDRLLLLNCHGGNREPLKLAADRLQRKCGLRVHIVHWSDFAREQLDQRWGEDWGHAGEHETSVVEHYFPELVHDDRKQHLGDRSMPTTRPYAYFEEVTETGGTGDPRQSNVDFIENVIDNTTDRILTALTEEL